MVESQGTARHAESCPQVGVASLALSAVIVSNASTDVVLGGVAQGRLRRLGAAQKEGWSFFVCSHPQSVSATDSPYCFHKPRVSGRLTSEERTKDHYLIRGILSTATKHLVNPLAALRDAFTGTTWLPPAATALA